MGLGFILFCILLSMVWFFIKNYKNRMLTQKQSVDVIPFSDYRVEEKRRRKRAEIVWPAFIVTDKGVIEGETKDLSRSGAFITCGKPLLPGERFLINIDIPKKGPVSLRSEVIWSNGNIPEEKVVSRGMGIRFLQNIDEDTSSLKSALEDYFEGMDNSPIKKVAFI